MQNLQYHKLLKPVRKYLRKHNASAEATLWKSLKKKQSGNFIFRRQQSIGEYVFDFYCPELKLAIELDGEPHASVFVIPYDTEREQWLNQEGIEVLRYENSLVFKYPEVILNEILEFTEKKKSTTSPGIPGTSRLMREEIPNPDSKFQIPNPTTHNPGFKSHVLIPLTDTERLLPVARHPMTND